MRAERHPVTELEAGEAAFGVEERSDETPEVVATLLDEGQYFPRNA